MNKRASVISCHGKNSGPITRAKAATLTSQGKRALAKPPLIPEIKQTKIARTKRLASEENKHIAPHATTSQNKKRAVFNDVSNVFCDISYKNCMNIVKTQAKTYTKQKIQLEHCKAKTKSDQKDIKHTTANLENLSDQGSTFISINLDRNVQSDSEIKGSIVDDKCILHKDEASLSCLGIHDIDLDFSNPLLCSLYVNDIYANLRVSELFRRPLPTFMETLQREINQGMRGILIDWLVEVAEEYKLVSDTLYLSVYAIDLFLSGNCVERQRLQLLGVTCMLIASKYEEICAPRVEEFCYITDNTYTKDDVLKMEINVLSYLDYRLSVPTIKTFLRRFLKAAQASYNAPSFILGYIANYLCELTLVEYRFLKYLPSVIAASAVFLARWTLDQSEHPWNRTLEHYTSYKSVDLKPAVLQMHCLQQNSSSSPLAAVRDKYIQEKYEQVASRVSSNIPDSIFL